MSNQPGGAPAAVAHRIASIVITHHRLEFDPPFHASWDTRPRVSFDATIVRVTTDTGLVGLGSGDRMLGFEGHEALFVGHDPLALERHYRVLSNIDFHYGRCWPLDLALWDLAGKITGQPCWTGCGPMPRAGLCVTREPWRTRPSVTCRKGSKRSRSVSIAATGVMMSKRWKR
jgi:L-alanine-DL-glutamate epimerase-like enolase superfamily enzyme